MRMNRTILPGHGPWVNRIVKSTLGTKRKLAALSGVVALFLLAATLAFALVPTVLVTGVAAAPPGTEIMGHNKADTITGSALADEIYARGGDDTVNAGAGNDIVVGGAGNDTINAEDGDDSVVAGSGDDFVNGGNGNNTLDGGEGADRLSAFLGDDMIVGGPGNDLIESLGGNDYLRGGPDDDTLIGGEGKDVLDGGDGNDTLYGEEERTDMSEVDSSLPERLIGGPGNDAIYAQDGRRDFVDCGPGNDFASVDAVDLTRSCEVLDGSGWGRSDLNVDPASVDFGNVPLDCANEGTCPSATLLVWNEGGEAVIESVVLTPPEDTGFTSQGCLDETLEPETGCSIVIKFSPQMTGTQSATLTIAAGDEAWEVMTVPLTANVVSSP